jgi:hypothetical protein
VVEIRANGVRVAQHAPERVGLFIIEADRPAAETYNIEIAAVPAWTERLAGGSACPAWWTGNRETIKWRDRTLELRSGATSVVSLK